MLVTTEAQLQVYFDAYSQHLWSTLRPEGLITPASELALKYGSEIPGTWHMLAIKDAEPVNTPEQWVSQERRLAEKFSTMPFLSEAVEMIHEMRRVFGRPIGCYGVTPLLIFRKIGG